MRLGKFTRTNRTPGISTTMLIDRILASPSDFAFNKQNTCNVHNSASSSQRKSLQVAFVGLGAMGWGIASNLAMAAAAGEIASPVLVWNRTRVKSEQHAAKFGTSCVARLADTAQADVMVTCLPTSLQVAEIAAEVGPLLK